jgi:inorganic triphosphatase YgiF
VTEPVEIEVKLSVTRPNVVLRRLARCEPEALAGFQREGRLRRVDVLDRYVDTADGLLAQADARARLRETPKAVVLTVKRRGTVKGVVTARVELEGPATRDLAPSTWTDSPARDVLMALAAGQALVETVRLRQRRAVRYLRRGPTRVEVSLDELIALRDSVPIATRWELEAELKAGDQAHLHDLADALQRIPGVGPSLGSKRGFAMAATAASASDPRPTPRV